MKNTKTQALVDSAIMIAISTVLILLSSYVPSFVLIGMFISGIPITIVTVKHGVKTALLASLALLLVLCIVLADFIGTFMLFLIMFIPGIIAGTCIKHDRGFILSLALVIISIVMAFMISIQILNIMYGDTSSSNFVLDFITEYANVFGDVFKARLDYIMSHGGAETLGDIDAEVLTKQITTGLINTLTLYFPSIIIIFSSVMGYLTLKTNAFFLRKLRVKEYRWNVPFMFLTAPKSVVYIMFLVELIVISTSGNDSSLVSSALMNMESILRFIVIVCGLSFIEFQFSRVVKKGAVRGIVYAVVFLFVGAFMSILSYIIEFIGMIDILFGFRRYLIERS